MRQFTEEEAEAYEEFLQKEIFGTVSRRQVIEEVLERFEDANLASSAARERIAEEVVEALKQ